MATNAANPSFVDVTREERFFCSVLMHVLLSESPAAQGALDRLAERAGVPLEAIDLEVYSEVAALRDAWAGLGPFIPYTPKVHDRRLFVLHGILTHVAGYTGSPSDLEEFTRKHAALFLSGGAVPKLHSPGRWPNGAMSQVPELREKDLQSIKWAFNAKPDLLLVSNGRSVIVEAKVESGFGGSVTTGYDQPRTQLVIARLLPIVLPMQFAAEPVCITLAPSKAAKDPRANVTWREVLVAADTAGLNDFSRRALARAAALEAKH
jgi:hypothetical protein